MRSRFRWVVLGALMVVAMGLSVGPGEAQLAGTPWPMFHHDLQHTGRSPYLGPQSPTLAWKFRTASDVNSSPAIGADGTIYFGSRDNYLYALNPDGTLWWKFRTGDAVRSSPAIGEDGTIYVGSDDGYLYAINDSGQGLSPWPMFHHDPQHTGRAG